LSEYGPPTVPALNCKKGEIEGQGLDGLPVG
jgi:hypothetical protein